MKPIRLEIKGLNSFIEKQVIDFEKLTERGLFGIFGPTGSGKSTILDGITLALYGDIARKSSNYINTNCDSVYVSYTFQITDKETKVYRVDREFKRDNKSGSIRNKSARVFCISEKEEKVLEEKSKAVTLKCENIIGLKLEDFMRTVVLPQGKFSEFLKLEGKARRDMLERLFNLEKYGDNLSNKLGTEIRKEKDKMNVLEGQLKGYEGISEEALKQKEEEIENIKIIIENKEVLLKKIREEFEEAKGIWDTQEELYKAKKEEEVLLKREDEIENLREKVAISNKADKVILFIERLDELLKEIKEENIKLIKFEEELKKVKALREKNKEEFQKATENKEKKLPNLRLNKEKLLEGKKEKELLFNVKKEGITLKKECNEILRKVEMCKNEFMDLENKEKKLSLELKASEKRKEEIFVCDDFKNRINDGLFILNSYEELERQLKGLKKEDITLKEDIKKLLEEKEKEEKNFKIKSQELNSKRVLLEELLNKKPGDNKDILEKKTELDAYKERVKRYEERKEDLEEALKNKNILEERLKVFETKRLDKEREVRNLKEYINKLKTFELANKLRENLVHGEVCPVCGSTHHEIKNIERVNIDNLKEETALLEKGEEDLKEVVLEFLKGETALRYEDKKIFDLNKSIEEIGEVNLEKLKVLEDEFNFLKERIEDFEAKKEKIERDLERLREESNSLENKFNKVEVILCEKIVREEELKKKIDNLKGELTEKEDKLNLIKSELNIKDIKLENERILSKSKERDSLEKSISFNRKTLEDYINKKEKLRGEKEKLREIYLEKKSYLESKVQVYREKERWIREALKDLVKEEFNVEEVDIDTLLDRINKDIDSIEREYLSLSEEKDELENKLNKKSEEFLVTRERINSLNLRAESEKEIVNKSLKEEGFKEVLEVKRSLISKIEKENLESIIKEYDKDLIKIRGNKELLIKKLSGRSLDKEEWISINNKKVENEKELKEDYELKVKLMTEGEAICRKLNEQKDILSLKGEQEHKLALLSDLEKLFKGKKFVEFIAKNQLKYISLEASKKLKDITNGIYGLEVDENGKFIIRDYKNGGAKRDASTLSGGETFLASLALALSLSSQIQLKGTAPLELFFLDEGFGTLDDSLLDVVMGSLERLHHERLSVGIISHVESIKNRVPIKLILTPAEAGIGGSKVKIERS